MEPKIFITMFTRAQSLVPIQGQIISVQIFTPYFIKIHLIIILKLWSSGLWHSAFLWADNYILEEHAVSIFRV
jgi:hypothetical protein